MDLQPIKTEHAPIPRGPYNQAIKAGDTVYVAGQIPVDPETNQIVEGDAGAQARRVFENVKAILEAAGASMDRVVKTTIFLADVNDFAAVNAVYARQMPDPPPARSTIGVGGLPRGARVEIEMIARRIEVDAVARRS